jgi:hypothetical protein
MADRTFAHGSGQELATFGIHDWLPNALASAVYWLEDRGTERRPLVCEDVIRHNGRSAYRHLGFVRSTFVFAAPSGPRISWLLGIPLDSVLGVTEESLVGEVIKTYPAWLLA